MRVVGTKCTVVGGGERGGGWDRKKYERGADILAAKLSIHYVIKIKT